MAAVISEARICAFQQLPRLPFLSRPQAPSYPCIVPLSRVVVSPTPTCIVILMESGGGEQRGKTIVFFCTSLSKALHSKLLHRIVYGLSSCRTHQHWLMSLLVSSFLKPLESSCVSCSSLPIWLPVFILVLTQPFRKFRVVLPEAPAPLPYIIHHGYPLVTGPPSRLPIRMLPLLILPEASLSSATAGIMKTMARL